MNYWSRHDFILAIACGGMIFGYLLAAIPGATVGGFVAAFYAWNSTKNWNQ